jgi:uncharacterized protein (DUF885 family)
MRTVIIPFILLLVLACNNEQQAASVPAKEEKSTALDDLLDKYYEERMALFPIEASYNGDTRYNDKLYPDFTDSYREKIRAFCDRTLAALKNINRADLNDNDGISYDFLSEYVGMQRQMLDYKFNRLPTDQMWGFHNFFGQLASGGSIQPFKTEADYRAWLKRVDAMDVWIDSAIVYFRKGIAENIVLPRAAVVKMIPQFEAMTAPDVQQHLFYGPIKAIPADFSNDLKQQLTNDYTTAIREKVIPMNRRMADFLRNEYLPKARSTSGYGDMPGGAEYYKLMVRWNTTTDKTPEEIYQTGLREVARIRGEMDSIRRQVGFKGDLAAFFEHLKTDPKFTPYRSPEDVLNAFRGIHQRIEPHLKDYFSSTPKTPFEIRQTEAFRAESASAEYNPSPDGVKPGVFYVPIIDARKFNMTSGMESLFLHEAIPGHHFQISLQRENDALPSIRRKDPWSNAYVEGWALYCESLGKELGLYTDPYQRMGALGDEIHRAIRLVVDVAIHSKGMSREEAIKYMMENEPISEQGAIAEIERYMTGPGQALGYKIGALKIRELRDKYQSAMGDKFRLSEFHTEFLKDGSMPLTTIEAKMDRWAAGKK